MKTKQISREYNLYGSNELVLLVTGIYLDLGNNFTLDHFMEELCKAANEAFCDVIYQAEFEIIKFSLKGKYGKIKIELTEFDFFCFFKHYYDHLNKYGL